MHTHRAKYDERSHQTETVSYYVATLCKHSAINNPKPSINETNTSAGWQSYMYRQPLWPFAARPSGYVLHNPLGTCCTTLWVRAAQPSGYALHGPLATRCTALWVRAARPSGYVLHGPLATCCTALWLRAARPSGYVLHNPLGTCCRPHIHNHWDAHTACILVHEARRRQSYIPRRRQ